MKNLYMLISMCSACSIFGMNFEMAQNRKPLTSSNLALYCETAENSEDFMVDDEQSAFSDFWNRVSIYNNIGYQVKRNPAAYKKNISMQLPEHKDFALQMWERKVSMKSSKPDVVWEANHDNEVVGTCILNGKSFEVTIPMEFGRENYIVYSRFENK